MLRDIFRILPSQELVFEPAKWNEDVAKQYLSNCFAYALNKQGLKWAFWDTVVRQIKGEFHRAGTVTSEIDPRWVIDMDQPSAPKSVACAHFAGFKQITSREAHANTKGRHIIAFSPHFDHFYRKDSNGFWSHKDGYKPATDCDDTGQKIISLEEARWCFPGCGIVGTREAQDKYLTHAEGMNDPSEALQYFEITDEGVYVEARTFDALMDVGVKPWTVQPEPPSAVLSL